MKPYLLALCYGMSAAAMLAQAPTPPTVPLPDTFVTGTIGIDYQSRLHRNQTGVVDTYTFNMVVSNTAGFRGTISQLPVIKVTTFGVEHGSQPGNLTYDLSVDIINPKNPKQVLANVGRLYGVVPVSVANMYDFDNGSLMTQMQGRGTAKAFDATFKGQAFGKPPVPDQGLIDKMKKEAMSFTKTVGNSVQKITITKYDIMEFRNVVLGAGPTLAYPDATVNGKFVYGYDRNSWYFKNLTITYWTTEKDGSQVNHNDSLSGDIQWREDPNRKTNGIGEYVFDIRINEPPPPENAQFTAPSTEDDFFTVDAKAVGLSGEMKYLDTMTSDGQSCTASQITLDLHGTKITRQQCMELYKLIMLVSVVPFNAE